MSNQRTESEIAHANAVREMFSGIAGRYDLLNHFLSLNIDKRWRRFVTNHLDATLADESAMVLDVACGTGDLAFSMSAHAKASIIGTDFCHPMLTIAAGKSDRLRREIPFVESDALNLPFDPETFDAVTIAFGLRNLSNVTAGIEELRRVLKKGGKLVVLEFSKPSVPGFGQLFNFYFSRVLPRIGGAVSGSKAAYEYLPDSVARFPDQAKLRDLIAESGFDDVRFRNLTGGIAALHSGTRAG